MVLALEEKLNRLIVALYADKQGLSRDSQRLDENGKPVSSSKFIEVHFRNGKDVQVGNEFGLGRKQR